MVAWSRATKFQWVGDEWDYQAEPGEAPTVPPIVLDIAGFTQEILKAFPAHQTQGIINATQNMLKHYR